MDIVASSKFVFCPRGNGIDTHRFWETYAANSIPVIFDEYYIKRDFTNPDVTALVIKDISELTPEFLEKKYIELSKNYNYDKKYLQSITGKKLSILIIRFFYTLKNTRQYSIPFFY